MYTHRGVYLSNAIFVTELLCCRGVTFHGPSRCYGYLITSNVGALTYFCVRGTVPDSTHCTASTGARRGSIATDLDLPRQQILAGPWLGRSSYL